MSIVSIEMIFYTKNVILHVNNKTTSCLIFIVIRHQRSTFDSDMPIELLVVEKDYLHVSLFGKLKLINKCLLLDTFHIKRLSKVCFYMKCLFQEWSSPSRNHENIIYRHI